MVVGYQQQVASQDIGPGGPSSLLGVGGLQSLGGVGAVMAVAGVAMSAIGSYYSAVSQRYAARSQALDLEFQGTMADLNARAAELEAQGLLEAGQLEKARVTQQYGALGSAVRVRQAAAGLQAGVGSAAEVQVSIEAAKEIDALTIERNAVRAAGVSRMRAVDFRNRALLARTSARSVRQMAGTISPGLAAFTSLLGGAGQVAPMFLAS